MWYNMKSQRVYYVQAYDSRSSPGKKYYVQMHDFNPKSLSCDCPAWTYRPKLNGERECKHTIDFAERIFPLNRITYGSGFGVTLAQTAQGVTFCAQPDCLVREAGDTCVHLRKWPIRDPSQYRVEEWNGKPTRSMNIANSSQQKKFSTMKTVRIGDASVTIYTYRWKPPKSDTYDYGCSCGAQNKCKHIALLELFGPEKVQNGDIVRLNDPGEQLAFDALPPPPNTRPVPKKIIEPPKPQIIRPKRIIRWDEDDE